jgi:hypothetical protein
MDRKKSGPKPALFNFVQFRSGAYDQPLPSSTAFIDRRMRLCLSTSSTAMGWFFADSQRHNAYICTQLRPQTGLQNVPQVFF